MVIVLVTCVASYLRPHEVRDQKRHKYHYWPIAGAVHSINGVSMFTSVRASTKSGTWNIPEHSGTSRNIPEHGKMKIIFMKKILIIIIIITIIIIIFVKINKYRKITKKRKRKKEGKRNSNHLRVWENNILSQIICGARVHANDSNEWRFASKIKIY